MSKYDIHQPQRTRPTRSVYLERVSNEVIITEEGYTEILGIIEATAVCNKCNEHYSVENPQVARLLCLRCFLRRHDFTFHGPLDPSLVELEKYEQPSKRQQYQFFDAAGHVHITEAGPGAQEEGRENLAATLKYWHFPRPKSGEKNGKMVDLNQYNWAIHGDVKHAQVILLQYGSDYHNNLMLFMALRHGEAIQLSNRKRRDRIILDAAYAEIEATRNHEGNYLIGSNHNYSWIPESEVYRIAAKLMNEMLRAPEELTREEAKDEP